jgi:adenylate cyclase
LKGKAVFVGQTESDWFKVNDGFYTVFTGESGIDISGVEIAATAFANLLEDKAVYPLGPKAHCAVVLFWGVLVALISLRFTTSICAAGLLLLNGLYLGVACFQFKFGGIWYPLVVPLLVQTPAAFISGLVWKYSKANAERSNIRKAFGHYLPQEVVNRLAANVKELNGGGKVLYSICLLTDAESYTPLSESLDPERLTHFMNTYYEAIFKPIKANNGQVLQVVGDSVLAIWSAPQPNDDLKSAACRSAIGISKAVRQFNATPGHHPLPTRIGLHAGEILLGNIGAMDHFEYRPVGDIVNTASRLEGLNKYLGTHMLASQEILIPGNTCPTRPVGQFVFKGKSKPVRVYEIFPDNGVSPEHRSATHRLFASGLQAFEHRRWDEADQYFCKALQINPKDGPSQFYSRLCRQYRQAPPEHDWDGAVRLDHK